MRALAFDTVSREVIITNGKTQTTDNPSIQNGIIIKDARCVNVFSPLLGIGFNPINSQSGSIVSELNRWKKQCLQDKAKTANFTLTQTGIPNAQVNIDLSISYL